MKVMMFDMLWLFAAQAAANDDRHGEDRAAAPTRDTALAPRADWLPLTTAFVGVGIAALWIALKPILVKLVLRGRPIVGGSHAPMARAPYAQLGPTVEEALTLAVLMLAVSAIIVALLAARQNSHRVLITGLGNVPWLATVAWGDQQDADVFIWAAAGAPLSLSFVAIARALERRR